MDSAQFQETDKVWDWVPCPYDIKRVTNESETIWNLRPSIQLSLPTDEGNVQPLVNMRTEMSKSFLYAEGIGWNWHKSWNMPDIICELDIRDPTTNERLAPPDKIYAELQIVKTAVEPTQTFHLLDVGLKGSYKVDMENGKCIFTGLKFDSTSYKHEHSKFHLVITMYLIQNKFEFPQILESRISPPIFIDSRRLARDISKQKKQKIQSYLDPFLPEALEKSFIKRDSKVKFSAEEEISSNVEGLINYFSAPNIRHKVKHPLFLAIKFSQCIKLYINTNRIQPESEEKVIEAIQQILYESYFQNQGAIMKIRIEQKPLLIWVDTMSIGQPALRQKKILEFLEPLKNDIIEIILDPVGVPKCFQQLPNINELASTYKRIYQKLVNQKFSLANNGIKNGAGETFKVELKGKHAKEQADNEDNAIIRKVVVIQGEDKKDVKNQDDYLRQLRTKRGASMNADIQVSPAIVSPSILKQQEIDSIDDLSKSNLRWADSQAQEINNQVYHHQIITKSPPQANPAPDVKVEESKDTPVATQISMSQSLQAQSLSMSQSLSAQQLQNQMSKSMFMSQLKQATQQDQIFDKPYPNSLPNQQFMPPSMISSSQSINNSSNIFQPIQQQLQQNQLQQNQSQQAQLYQNQILQGQSQQNQLQQNQLLSNPQQTNPQQFQSPQQSSIQQQAQQLSASQLQTQLQQIQQQQIQQQQQAQQLTNLNPQIQQQFSDQFLQNAAQQSGMNPQQQQQFKLQQQQYQQFMQMQMQMQMQMRQYNLNQMYQQQNVQQQPQNSSNQKP